MFAFVPAEKKGEKEREREMASSYITSKRSQQVKPLARKKKTLNLFEYC